MADSKKHRAERIEQFFPVIASTPPQSNWSDLRKKPGFGMESGELVT